MTTVAAPPCATAAPKPATRPFFSFHLALAALLAMWALFFCGKSVADPDVWWHIKNAQYLITQHKFIRVDMYSYTVAGTPWLDHEWLSEIPFYFVWKAGGLLGLYVLYSLLVEGVLAGLFYLAYKASGNVKSAFVASFVGTVLAVVNFGPRNILFGWAYLIILLLIMLKYRRTGTGPLWVIPGLFCLWINSHGSWLIGLIVFALIIGSGMVGGVWGKIEAVRWSPRQMKEVLATAAASVAALFLNPYWYRLVYYPFDLGFRQKLNIEHVEEWMSVNFHEPRGKVVLLFLFAILAAALLHRRRWRLEEVALTLFGLYAGLTYVRFLFLAAILITPVLARRLDLPPYRPEIDKPLLNAAMIALLVTIMITRLPSQAILDNDIALKEPLGGLAYLEKYGHSARVFNNYGWGGYMILHTPSVRPFIDSRTDIFEYNGLLKDYLDVIGIHTPLEILDKHRIRYVLFQVSDPLSYLLSNTPAWKVVYKDGVSVVFERVGS
jgi:hypothetical protein